MAHFVVLHDSFEEIGHLKQSVQDEIGRIIASLEGDEFFEPSDKDYLFERDPQAGICVCQHISNWSDWQLTWFYEYSPHLPSTVESVVVMLVRQPLLPIQPK